MNTLSIPSHFSRRRMMLAVATVCAGSLLAACGGGGSDSSAGTGGTGGTSTIAAYTSGPITGFGSIIVGGVRFEDSTATITDDNGATKRVDDLKLGTMVEIEAEKISRDATTGAASAKAVSIGLGGSIKGRVEVKGTDTLVVIGQNVLVTTNTVFGPSLAGGLGALVANVTEVEVHGHYDAANKRIVATRIDLETGTSEYRTHGEVTDLNTAAKTFKIGSATIDYSKVPAAEMRAAPVNGQHMRVRLQTTQVNGAWVATRVGSGVRTLESRSEAHVEGVVTSGSGTSFSVNGVPVDASKAVWDDGMSASAIAAGVRVEIEGALVNGVLVATKVEAQERRTGTDGKAELEFHGTLSALDTANKTFQIRGVTVWYGGTVAYRDGNEAKLSGYTGQLEVKGVLSADRSRVEAQKIQFH